MGGNGVAGIGIVFVIVFPIGFGQCFPVKGVNVIGVGGTVFPDVTGIGFFAAGAVGEEEVVLLAEGIEFARQVILPGDIVAVIFVTLDVFGCAIEFTAFFDAREFAAGIADKGKLFVRRGVDVIQFAVKVPMVV